MAMYSKRKKFVEFISQLVRKQLNYKFSRFLFLFERWRKEFCRMSWGDIGYWCITVVGCYLVLSSNSIWADTSFSNVIDDVQPKIVKIYGAGGFRGLEPYQSGFLISPQGHIVTAWSYVLDTDELTVTLNNGRRFDAQILGSDPRTEIALLKIEGSNFPCFDLGKTVEVDTGSRILAFSNIFGVATGDEPASVLHGCIAARSALAARRGAFVLPYKGPAYILDAMTNNPGAAGGALTDRQGQLTGVLGKELRDAANNTWLNYAIPINELRGAIDDIRAGKIIPRHMNTDIKKPKFPTTVEHLGISLVPDILTKTPPFIDKIGIGSLAELAGLRTDDLILYVDEHMVQSCKEFVRELEMIDKDDKITLTVRRDQELVTAELQANSVSPATPQSD